MDQAIEIGKRVKITHVIDPEVWWEHAEFIGKTGKVVDIKRNRVPWDVVIVVEFSEGDHWGYREEELEVLDGTE
jgi:ribosomal protein L21E